jgi:hypothetical protein
MREYYTYAYLREDRTPYYIGKGKGNRIHNSHNRVVHKPPKDRRVFLKTGLTETEAFRHEVYMIALYGRKDLGTGILWNFTDGGEGTSGYKWTPEQREALSVSSTGKKYGEEMKEKCRSRMTGLKRSEETRKKMSNSLKGNQRNKGKLRSDETKRKIAESMKGNTNRKKSINH